MNRKISLKMAGKAVAIANALAENAVAAHCRAEGPGLTGSYLAQQIETSFTISAFAEGENGKKTPALIGLREFKVSVRGPGEVYAFVKDKGDGRYVVTLTYPMSGRYEVRISLERTPISGSPFHVTVRAAGKPAACPPPRFCAGATSNAIEWDEPEHTGGMPLVNYTVYRLPKTLWEPVPSDVPDERAKSMKSIFRPPAESEYEVIATTDPKTRRCELPALQPGERRSVHFNGFAVAAINSKGAGERSTAGPAPVDDPISTFDASGTVEVRAEMLRRFDKEQQDEQDSRFWFLLGGFKDRRAALAALDGGEISLVMGCVMRRLKTAAAIFVGAAMRRGDIERAVEQAGHVAMLQHVLAQASANARKEGRPPPTGTSFVDVDVAGSVEASRGHPASPTAPIPSRCIDPSSSVSPMFAPCQPRPRSLRLQASTLMQQQPAIKAELQKLGGGPLFAEDLEEAALDALPKLQLEIEAEQRAADKKAKGS